MTTRHLVLSLLGTLLFLGGCSGTGDSSDSGEKLCEGYHQNAAKQSLTWEKKFPITFTLDSQFPDDFAIAIKNAMTTWNANFGMHVFELSPNKITAGASAHGLRRNIIYWQETWSQKDKTLEAATHLVWQGARITKADIYVNAESFRYSLSPTSEEIDIESLILHELGHVLGLDHNNRPDSIMQPKLRAGLERREVSEKDLETIQCEYSTKVP